MKKFFSVIFVFSFIIASIIAVSFFNTKSKDVSCKASGFAQINNNGAMLYVFPSDSQDYSNTLFIIEPSYFVKLLEKPNEDFYKVEYNSITGYVKCLDVSLVDNTPLKPYLKDITFEIKNNCSAYLRSEPSTKNSKNILKILPAGTKNIEYLGKISGEESISNLGNIWYYCKITDINDNLSYGYVYSSLTTNLSTISLNTEDIKNVNASSFDFVNLLYINISTQNLIVAVLCFPMLLIIYLFTKPTKVISKLNN